jgi:hypothetical protein
MAIKQNTVNKYWNYFFLGWQNFREGALEVFEPLLVRILFLANLVFNIFLWIATYRLNKIASQDLIVLHYNVDFGVKLIGSVHMLYIIPAISLLIIISNFILMISIKRLDNFLTYLLICISSVCNVFLFIGLGMVYLINF